VIMVKLFSITLFFISLVGAASRRLGKGGKGSKGSYVGTKSSKYPVSVGSRPYFILDTMAEGELKEKLVKCAETEDINYKNDWSIGHRGACMLVSIFELLKSILIFANSFH